MTLRRTPRYEPLPFRDRYELALTAVAMIVDARGAYTPADLDLVAVRFGVGPTDSRGLAYALRAGVEVYLRCRSRS